MAGWNFTIMVHQRTKDEINGCVGLCRLRLRMRFTQHLKATLIPRKPSSSEIDQMPLLRSRVWHRVCTILVLVRSLLSLMPSYAKTAPKNLPLFFLPSNNLPKCFTLDVPAETNLEINYEFPGKLSIAIHCSITTNSVI